jgi:hypothetical protein
MKKSEMAENQVNNKYLVIKMRLQFICDWREGKRQTATDKNCVFDVNSVTKHQSLNETGM